MGATEDSISKLADAWAPLRDALGELGPDRLGQATDAGWTARELLAHIAFWDEAAVPVIQYMLRGQEIPKQSWFASGYEPGAEQWPGPDVHNAREAAWGREHSGEEVIERATRAHEAMMATVASLQDDEAAERAGYLTELVGHYEEHLPELRALL